MQNNNTPNTAKEAVNQNQIIAMYSGSGWDTYYAVMHEGETINDEEPMVNQMEGVEDTNDYELPF